MAKRKQKPKPPAKRKRQNTRKIVALTENLPPPAVGHFTPHAEPAGEEPWGDDGLTIRQRLFVAALIGPAGGVATKAAEMAGYASENRDSLKVTASQILTYPNVQQALAHALAAKKLTPEWAKNQLADMASASMANFVTVDENGKATIDFARAAAIGALGQIKELKEELIEVPGSSGGPLIIKRTLKLHDRTRALDLLLKFHGLVKGDDSDGGSDPYIEANPAMDAAAPAPGTVPPLVQPAAVQDRSGGAAQRKDGDSKASPGAQSVGRAKEPPAVG